ncbi:DUF982 domain-containing protein [Pseudaminobacter salicylatoxidans]|uniref:DUF982 domain-containing protein n=1 Tax=Pseudaminobacter salicylatoxidans TaxID=93369 RepID=UPI0012F6895A|nr:DUF982 domain-containing protein [Pseudaminobacter salicylatoxidans]
MIALSLALTLVECSRCSMESPALLTTTSRNFRQPSALTAMQDRFEPVTIMLTVGQMRNVTSVVEAGEALLDARWLDKKSQLYKDAVSACVAWEEDRATLNEVREAFRDAAGADDVLIR